MDDQSPLPELTEIERRIYQWQMWVPGVGEIGQCKLKNASVMISRVGGVGGLVALQLAAAGIGKLVLAHAGQVQPSDLNRQLLVTDDWIGRPRIESIRRRLLQLNPRLDLVCVDQNVDSKNAESLLSQADLVVDCAPLFTERFAMNAAACRQGKPMIECAMYEMEAQLTTIIPGQTACLRCIQPEAPPNWTRQFPVFGAVAGSVACLAAVEAIKLICGLGSPLLGKLLSYDLLTMNFVQLQIQRRGDCDDCGHLN
jgi:molybdopterin/thiamine biosynthesis adenylyltransferase